MFEVLDFLGNKARGFILTLTGTGVGLSPDVIQDQAARTALEPLQTAVLLLTGIVAIMTITSYGYKFYKWCKLLRKDKEK